MKIAKNKRVMMKYESEALKFATNLYFHEQQKEGDRKSAKECEKITKLRYSGVGPTARTIIRYVNAYHLVGTSPLKVGSPGDIPPE